MATIDDLTPQQKNALRRELLDVISFDPRKRGPGGVRGPNVYDDWMAAMGVLIGANIDNPAQVLNDYYNEFVATNP